MLNKVQELVNKGYDQKLIAKELNISRDQAKRLLRKNGIKSKAKQNVSNPEVYRKAFDEYYVNRFVYVGDYINNVSQITIKCLNCGHEFKRNASALRGKINIRCDKCYELEIQTLRAQKKESIKLHKQELKRLKLLSKPIKIKIHREPSKHICKECHEEFVSSRRKYFCSTECCDRYNNATKKNLKRKRIEQNGKTEDITLTSLIKKEKNVCHICGKKCNRKDYVITKQGYFIAGKSYPSIDHVIPVSKGGTHTWDNVKLAHMSCNSIKSNNSCYEMNDGVIRMCI